MFKFDKSSVTTNDESSNKEHKRNASDMSNDDALLLATTTTSASGLKTERNSRDKSLVCKPNSALIRVLYLPLSQYIHEIETFMKCKSGQPSSLREFLSNHVKETFLAKGHNQALQSTLESLSKNHDAWRAIITAEEIKALGLNRPLLQSTVLFENR